MKSILKISQMTILINLLGVVVLFTIIMFTGGTDLLFGNQTGRVESIFIMICINIVMTVSLNIAAGSLGEIVLGHAGFMAIGAYTAGLFAKGFHLEGNFAFIGCLLVGGVIAGIFGLIVGIPTLRLRGDYLAIVTLGFGEIIRNLIQNVEFTGGAKGLTAIPMNLTLPLAVITMIICVSIVYSFMTTRHGRAILAIREDEIAAEAAGINVTRYKSLAFTVSAFFAGIGGAMYAQNIGGIYPANFSTDVSINYLAMVVFGGMGSYTGAVLSASVLTTLNILLTDFAEYRMIIYSIALILIMIYRPSGLLGIKEFSLTKTLNRFFTKRKEL